IGARYLALARDATREVFSRVSAGAPTPIGARARSARTHGGRGGCAERTHFRRFDRSSVRAYSAAGDGGAAVDLVVGGGARRGICAPGTSLVPARVDRVA